MMQIIFIGFIRNSTTMVSVDELGYVNIWPYEAKAFTGFGWFLPDKKLKLNLSEETWTPLAEVGIVARLLCRARFVIRSLE